jgi:hypothetical protein
VFPPRLEQAKLYPPAVSLFRTSRRPNLRPFVVAQIGDGFKVSGVTHRQDALRRAGGGSKHTFALVPEPKNPVDPNAVAIYCKGIHIGYISASMCARYLPVIAKFKAVLQLHVHGGIHKDNLGRYFATMDCPFPEDITLPL